MNPSALLSGRKAYAFDHVKIGQSAAASGLTFDRGPCYQSARLKASSFRTSGDSREVDGRRLPLPRSRPFRDEFGQPSNHALTCCMGCLGYVIAPEPGSNVALVGFSSLIRYGEWPCALAGRVPYTEPDPPDPAHEVDFVAESPSSGGNFSLSG